MPSIKPIFEITHLFAADNDFVVPFDFEANFQPAVGIDDHIGNGADVDNVGAVKAVENPAIENFFQLFQGVINNELP